MAGKLKSILRRIHWPLLSKAAAFFAAYAFLLPEHPVFFGVFSIALYFTPLFGWTRMRTPYVAMLLLSFWGAPSLLEGALLAVAAGLLFGSKELIFVDRVDAFRSFSLTVLFVACMELFRMHSGWLTPGGGGTGAFWGALLLAIFFYFLSRRMLSYIEDPKELPLSLRHLCAVAALLVWQVVGAIVFLPTSFLPQSAIVFAVIVMLLEFLPDYVRGQLTKERLLVMTFAVFATGVIILSSAAWSYGNP